MTALALSAFSAKRRVMRAIVLREMRVRFARRQLGYLWAAFEPLAHISLFIIIFRVLERVAPVPEGMAVFFGTGILPWLLFVRTATRVSDAASANKALLVYPHIFPVDFMLCRIFIEAATFLIVALFLGLLAFLIVGFVPENPLEALAAWTVIALLGGAVGMINAVILQNAPSYENFWKIAQRILYFTCGLFFVVSDLPQGVRDVLKWHPMAHGIDWFRDSVLPGYHSDFYDAGMLSVTALSLLAVGLMLERLWRKELRTP